MRAPSVALTTKAGEAVAEREANALTRPDSDNYLVARSSENVEQLEKRGVPLSTCLHGARAVNRWLIPASMDRETSGGNSPVTLSNMNPDMRNCPRVATARVSTRWTASQAGGLRLALQAKVHGVARPTRRSLGNCSAVTTSTT